MIPRCKLPHQFLWLALALTLAGCAVPITIPVPLATMSDDLDVDSLHLAIGQSLFYLQKLPPERIVGEQPRPLTTR